MMTFRKISAASVGAQIAAYFTENTPDPSHDFRTDPGRQLDSGGRLTSYYTGRDGRAVWRPDLGLAVAAALGVDRREMPRRDELARLFEGKRGDTGAAWTGHERTVSAYDLTLAPHKSITLAAEFASTDAERAAFWHAIQCANDDTMRYVARELGWARKGRGGQDGADPGQVGWVSFHHETARPIGARPRPERERRLSRHDGGGQRGPAPAECAWPRSLPVHHRRTTPAHIKSYQPGRTWSATTVLKSRLHYN